MKALVLGAGGKLGRDLCMVLEERCQVTALSHADLDVTDRDRVFQRIRSERPDVTFNVAAFMNAERCESFPTEAYTVNAVAAGYVSEACAETNAVCVYFSSDFVFDGKKDTPLTEADCPRPLSRYGMAKLSGEFEVAHHCERHYVFRTASLFGPTGPHFIEQMLKKGMNREPIQVVSDLIMSPTYTRDLAVMALAVVEQRVPFGLYHLANQGEASWYQFCVEAFRLAGVTTAIAPLSQADVRHRATRPMYSALTSIRLPEEIRRLNRRWDEALAAYIQEIGRTAKGGVR